jgi:hypothetical protein
MNTSQHLPTKFNSMIGVYVEPTAMGQDAAIDFDLLLAKIAICLAKNQLMNLRLVEEVVVSRLASQFPQSDFTNDCDRLEKMFAAGVPISGCFKEFCRYAPHVNAARFIVNDLVRSVEAVKQALAESGVLERAEVATWILDLSRLPKIPRFQTVYPENFPLPFERHIPKTQQ